jgi:WD40 repeat protein
LALPWELSALAWSPDGRRLVAADAAFRVWRWDIADGAPREEAGTLLSSPEGGHRGAILWLLFSPGGERLVSSCYDGSARLWDLETGESRPLLVYSTPAVAFSPDGGGVLLSGLDGTLRYLEAALLADP